MVTAHKEKYVFCLNDETLEILILLHVLIQ